MAHPPVRISGMKKVKANTGLTYVTGHILDCGAINRQPSIYLLRRFDSFLFPQYLLSATKACDFNSLSLLEELSEREVAAKLT